MRPFLIAFLSVLLVIAPLGTMARAQLHAAARGAESTTSDCDHHGKTGPHQHLPSAGDETAGCCGGLGCASAFAVMPGRGNVVRLSLLFAVRYRWLAVFRHALTLRPEPEPPRPNALA
jgi:hypothetical protein